ncbi:MAG: DUF4858 domain-containing protein, partial [Bacteroides sp.]|nr:DUF4858 domain-containing protein [Bacteroides sp.]
MKRFVLFWGLLSTVAFPCCAQNWHSQDSLKLDRLLKGEGEVKLNPKALQELEKNLFLGTPKAATDKPWMDFDTSLPVMPKVSQKKVVLTLRPYT